MPRCGIPTRIAEATKTWFQYLGKQSAMRPFMLELLDRYRHKIKTAEELRDIIGPRPRKKVIMCHGVFDIVHPGHVRHLLYAKSKADLLIASLTADHHITKGSTGRTCRRICARSISPRSRWSTTSSSTRMPRRSKIMRVIQPDYFAKGYEYTASGDAGRPREEADVVESYGGEIIFTPGDIVYSSST